MIDGTFRAATAGDIAAMQRIVARRPAIAQNVSGWIERSWVYVYHSNLIAFASRGIGSHQLHALYVASEFRSNGLGSTFLDHVEREISSESAFIELFVQRNNPKAKKFYLRNGYQARVAVSGWMMSKCFRIPPSLEDGRAI